MKGKKKIYNLVNVIFLLGAFVSLNNVFIFEFDNSYKTLNFNIIVLAVFFISFFMLVHTIKLFRFYLILIDENIKIERFIKIYIKTTFVNILLPFKLGEIFRFYCYTNETSNYKVGVLSILVERFFDTLVLVTLLIPIEFYTMHKLSISTFILLTFIIALSYAYATFKGLYDYMNHFFIFNVASNKSIGGLKVLERLHEWYQYIRKLVAKRTVFIFGLSLLAWMTELSMFYFLSMLLHKTFTLETFSGYLNAALIGGKSSLLTMYQMGASALFAIILIFVYIPTKKRRVQNV